VQELHTCGPVGRHILAHFHWPTVFNGPRQNDKDGPLLSRLPGHKHVGDLLRDWRQTGPSDCFEMHSVCQGAV
jgi:hypothetical protein